MFNLMALEEEVRRSSYLTTELENKIKRDYPQPVETLFLIFNNNIRAYLNPVPLVEEKKILYTTPLHLDTTFGQSIEVCYVCVESRVGRSVTQSIVKEGVLMKKTILLRGENLILYTLECQETTAGFHRDKVVIELENPNKCSWVEKLKYHELSFNFKLLVDDKSIKKSVSNVKYSASILSGSIEMPKVDGTRGILTFYERYAIFTSNLSSFIIEPHKIWDENIYFFLRNVQFVAEYVESTGHIVLIDTVYAKYVNAEKRYLFIQRLAELIRPKCQIPSTNILFQGYDKNYISTNCPVDGVVLIFDGSLYKRKFLSTVDLKYERLANGMVDRDGTFYASKLELHILKNLIDQRIYECVLDSDENVTMIYKERMDKFYPNARSTVKAMSCKTE